MEALPDFRVDYKNIHYSVVGLGFQTGECHIVIDRLAPKLATETMTGSCEAGRALWDR